MVNRLINNNKLIKEWDYEKNNKLGIKPDEITIGSQKKVWWKCHKGHSYDRSVYDRLNGRGNCPYCSNRKVLKGYNDLVTTNPELLKEWDYEKNNELGIKPDEITNGGKNKVWWKCFKGHEWNSIIRSRITGSGCPYCSNNLVKRGYNDLATTNPELLDIWNYEKNISITPYDVSYGSTKSVWWKCHKSHEWKAKISDIVKGNRCPYCSHKKILEGYNDLVTLFPDIVQYWDFDKNKKLPTEVFSKSNIKVWWKCEKGHSYQMTINSKTRGNYHSCPVCNKYKRVSVSEKIIYYYLKKVFNNIEENYRPDWLKSKEIDIYLPELNIGIEYDGFRYHKEIKEDLTKDILCEQNDVKLIRIREKECPEYLSSSIKIKLIDTYSQEYKYLKYGLLKLSNILNLNLDIDIERDLSDVLKMIDIGNKNNCIAISNAEILEEWDYEENEKMGISPYNVSKGTNIKVWWKCEKGHKYKASISIKTNQHTGCPYCNGRKILEGFNDLTTTNPELIEEWDYEKNSKMPNQVSKWDIRYYYWKCSLGHSYKASISMRTSHNTGCPICSGHRTLQGYNDLTTTNPELIKEWDFSKNDKLSLYMENYTRGNDIKVWWKCEKGHSYEMRINARIGKKNGCPYCANKKILKGYNDLVTTNPELIKEWDCGKNDKLGLYMENYTRGSNIKVWWKCEKGHSYEMRINARIGRKNSCPYCSGNQILKGYNDLATTNPELLDIWNYEKNNILGIIPENISKSYSRKVWWKCPKGHEYERYVYNQRKGNGKCPICKKEKI